MGNTSFQNFCLETEHLKFNNAKQEKQNKGDEIIGQTITERNET